MTLTTWTTLFIFYCIMIPANQAFAENKYIQHPETLPTELRLILSSKFTPGDINSNLFNTIDSLDKSIGQIPDEELSLILKVEVLRGLMKSLKEDSFVLEDLYKLDSKRMKSKADEFPANSLYAWLSHAILSDFNDVTSNSGLRGLILARKQGQKNILPQLLRLEKKAKVVAPFAQRLNDLSTEELAMFFDECKMSALKTIAPKIILSLRERGISITLNGEQNNWKHFKLMDYVEPVASKTVEEIVDSTQSESSSPAQDSLPEDELVIDDTITPIPAEPANAAETSSNSWTPPEQANNPNLPKNWPTPSPDYVSPKKLPDPVNDWIFDL